MLVRVPINVHHNVHSPRKMARVVGTNVLERHVIRK
jgi:hypothetical protein